MQSKNANSFADFSKKLIARAKDIKERVEFLRKKQVVVGIPEDAKYPNGKSVAEVAECITFGRHENGRPMKAGPRRFMTVAMEENRGAWGRILQEGVRKALLSKERSDLRPTLIKVGERMKNDIQRTMKDMKVSETGRMHDSITILKINGKEVHG